VIVWADEPPPVVKFVADTVAVQEPLWSAWTCTDPRCAVSVPPGVVLPRLAAACAVINRPIARLPGANVDVSPGGGADVASDVDVDVKGEGDGDVEVGVGAVPDVAVDGAVVPDVASDVDVDVMGEGDGDVEVGVGAVPDVAVDGAVAVEAGVGVASGVSSAAPAAGKVRNPKQISPVAIQVTCLAAVSFTTTNGRKAVRSAKRSSILLLQRRHPRSAVPELRGCRRTWAEARAQIRRSARGFTHEARIRPSAGAGTRSPPRRARRPERA
jgi:hypothetical protein